LKSLNALRKPKEEKILKSHEQITAELLTAIDQNLEKRNTPTINFSLRLIVFLIMVMQCMKGFIVI
jgi:hypothetical protein